MRTYISSLNEVVLELYEKGKAISDALISKAKHFYAELEGGPVNALGHIRRWHARKKDDTAFAAFCSTPAIIAIMVANGMANDAAALTREIAQKFSALFATSAASGAENKSLAAEFTNRMGVGEDVYQALHQREEIINFETSLDLIKQRTEEALSNSFIGPLTQQFEAARNNPVAVSNVVLHCTFEACTKLAQHGIKYIPEDNSYLFRKEILRTEFARLGKTAELERLENTTAQQDTDDFIRVFKERAQDVPEPTQRVIRLQWSSPKYGGGLQPVPVLR